MDFDLKLQIVGGLIAFILVTFVVKVCWNRVIPHIIPSTTHISFLQSLCLLILLGLFKFTMIPNL
jgi:hypothetical protein